MADAAAVAALVGAASTKGFSKLSDAAKWAERLLQGLQASRASQGALQNDCPPDGYIGRGEVEDSLRRFLVRDTSLGQQNYMIVAGARGVGKTTLVYHVVKDIPAVVTVHVDRLSTPASILAKIIKACGLSSDGAELDDVVQVLIDDVDAKRKAKEQGNDTLPPIKIIFDVDRSGSGTENLLKDVSHLAKAFAPRANVVVIVSEANAAMEFTKDPRRQKVLWVGEMAEDEFKALWRKLRGAVNKDEFDNFVAALGCSPLELVTYHSECTAGAGAYDVKVYIRDTHALVVEDLDKFPFKLLLAKVKEAVVADKPGCPIHDLIGVVEKGVELNIPTEVFAVVKTKDSNAIMYHRPSSEYRPISRCHAVVLKAYDIPQM